MSTDVLSPVHPTEPAAAFVDDDSWAQPRAQAGRGWRVFAGLLALSIFGIGVFTFGVKYQRNRPVAATGGAGAGAFGRNFPGGLGGFGGAGAGGATAAGGTGVAAPTQDQLTAILGQLSGDTSTAATSAGSAIRGKVTKVDGTSVTVTKADGSTVTVTLSGQTQVGRRAVAVVSDIVAGADVLVSGPVGTDGAVAADEITLGDLPPVPTTTVAATTATTAPGLGGLLPG